MFITQEMEFMPGTKTLFKNNLSGLSKRQFFKVILSTKDYLSAHVVTIIKLELYDMVDVKKTKDSGAQYDWKKYFEGWLLA